MKMYFKVMFLILFTILFFNIVPKLISSNSDELFIIGVISIICFPVTMYYLTTKLLIKERK